MSVRDNRLWLIPANILLIIFAFFLNAPYFEIISFICLALLLILLIAVFRKSSINELLDSFRISAKKLGYCIDGAVIGFVFAASIRIAFDKPIFPGFIAPIAAFYASIGICEELFYRGYVQKGLLGFVNKRYFAVSGASFLHTIYKGALFFLFALRSDFNILMLLGITFAAGIVFGILTEISDSVLPASSAHAVFDILVYCDATSDLWWIW